MTLQNKIERLLQEFVNREHELARFRDMLDNSAVNTFVIWGAGGVGKSSVQAKMMNEVESRGIDMSKVIWSETRNHDFMAIARKIRDDIGPEYFKRFTDLINFFTVPQYKLNISVSGDANISVAEGAQFAAGAQVGDVSGILVKDVNLTQPRADMQVSASERRTRLTDALIEGIGTALAERPLVVFFDATEKMTKETQEWVWGELRPAANDGRMGRIKFVLCGRIEPKVDRLWRDVVEVAELKPLAGEHVLAYLKRRGVQNAGREQLASMLLVITKGNMLELATHVDGYLDIQKRHTGEGAPGH